MLSHLKSIENGFASYVFFGRYKIQWFEEKETAVKSGRPVFSNMMKQLQKRKGGGVIIHKIDRSACNLADGVKIEGLSGAGVDVHFAPETLDFSSRGCMV